MKYYLRADSKFDSFDSIRTHACVAIAARRDVIELRATDRDSDSVYINSITPRTDANSWIVGCWVYKRNLMPITPFDTKLNVYAVKFGDSLIYEGQDERKANQVFQLLKETKENAKALETTVSVLITA